MEAKRFAGRLRVSGMRRIQGIWTLKFRWTLMENVWLVIMPCSSTACDEGLKLEQTTSVRRCCRCCRETARTMYDLCTFYELQAEKQKNGVRSQRPGAFFVFVRFLCLCWTSRSQFCQVKSSSYSPHKQRTAPL